MAPDDFAILILTHGRPQNVVTLQTLQKCGYTGPSYLVVDTDDPSLPEYQRNFPGMVRTFDKPAQEQATQNCDNFWGQTGTVVYARNACWQIAADLGITTFLQLDDDYITIYYAFDSANVFWMTEHVRNLDAVLEVMLDYFQSAPFLTLAMMQTGDFIGGPNSPRAKSLRLHRKAMNSFLCSTERPFQFVGRVNEDVNTYTLLGSQGHLIGSINQVAIKQTSTQQSSGGMTDWYESAGTYHKSFYPVMVHPSGVKVSTLNAGNPRPHHTINWDHTVPKIIHESHRKAA